MVWIVLDLVQNGFRAIGPGHLAAELVHTRRKLAAAVGDFHAQFNQLSILKNTYIAFFCRHYPYSHILVFRLLLFVLTAKASCF